MIKIKTGDLGNVIDALGVFKKSEGVPPKPGYRAMRILHACRSEFKKWNAYRIERMLPFTRKDEKGAPCFVKWADAEDGERVKVPATGFDPEAEFDIPADQVPEANKVHQELCEDEVEIPFDPIDVCALGDAKVPMEVFEIAGGCFVDE